MADQKKLRIVSIGECMVELSPAGDGHYQLGFAGDTLNTAWYLRRQMPEARVDYLTAVGTDDISNRMVSFLEGAGIGTDKIARIPERTVGLYLIELTKSERSFAYWRSASAAKLLAADPARLMAGLAGTDLAYFSGITLAILSPEDRQSLLATLAKARAGGTLVVFDPNLRPRLWPDAETMRAEIMRAAGFAEIILPSFDDEAAAFGDEAPLQSAERYLAAGANLVVTKNGAGEIAALPRGGEALLWTPPPAAEVIDSTAAGDSFNAGFLAAHLGGASLAECLAAGARLAGEVIGHRGALLPL